MPRVDFYLMDAAPQACYVYLCRIINKAYQRRHKIYIHCASNQEANDLDDLLWTFQEDSFIPHNLAGEGPTPPPPVQLGYTDTAPAFYDILINLNQQIPEFYGQFKRVLEVVSNDDKQKAVSREHYRFYGKAGCTLQAHNIALTAET